jgi:hypothetical protein
LQHAKDALSILGGCSMNVMAPTGMLNFNP